MIIDDETWAIKYLAVDTRTWWFGAHVLIKPRWIDSISWGAGLVNLRVTRDIIKSSPTWTPTYPISAEYEERLANYYSLRQAWSEDPRSLESPLQPRAPRA